MKQLIIAFLLAFVIIPSINAQVSTNQGIPCPSDGEFNYAEVMTTVFIPGSGDPIYDLDEYFSCFTEDENSYYEVSICVDQPVPETRRAFALTRPIDVGHTFLIFYQRKQSGEEIIRSLGFYPKMSVRPDNPRTKGRYKDDSTHEFNICVKFKNVSSSDFNFCLSYCRALYILDYDLNTNNCTTVAIDVLNSINLNIPKTIGNWKVGQGCNPGDLGEDLRDLKLLQNQERILNNFAPINIPDKC